MNHLQAKAFDSGTTTFSQVWSLTQLYPNQEQTQVANPGHDDILQDEGSALQMGEQTQGFVDQIGFTNMYSFE